MLALERNVSVQDMLLQLVRQHERQAEDFRGLLDQALLAVTEKDVTRATGTDWKAAQATPKRTEKVERLVSVPTSPIGDERLHEVLHEASQLEGDATNGDLRSAADQVDDAHCIAILTELAGTVKLSETEPLDPAVATVPGAVEEAYRTEGTNDDGLDKIATGVSGSSAQDGFVSAIKKSTSMRISVGEEIVKMNSSKTFFDSDIPEYWKKKLEEKREYASITTSSHYELMIMGLIVLNSLYMGWQVQQAAVTGKREATYIGMAFSIIFIIDLLTRIVTQRAKFFIGEDRQWNWFDFVIVGVMAGDSVRRFYESEGHASNFSLFRVVRLARLLRFLQILRVLAAFHDFHVIIGTLRRTLSAMLWVLILVSLLVYMIAIVMTEGTVGICLEDGPPVCKRFGDLFLSMLSLHQAMFFGIPWYVLMDELLLLDFWFPVIFFSFISFSVIVVLNLMTAVCCGLDNETRQFETAQGYGAAIEAKEQMEERSIAMLHEIFSEFDVNDSQDISFDEFVHCLNNPRAIALFAHLEIDVTCPRDLFDLLDSKKTKVLERDDFVLGCMRLKGGAKTSTVAHVQNQVEAVVADVANIKHVCNQIAEVMSTQPEFRALAKVQSMPDIVAMKDEFVHTRAKKRCKNGKAFWSRSASLNGPFQSIKKTEERAMTLGELRELRRIIRDNCVNWVDCITGVELTPKTVTLYGLNYHHLSPVTAMNKCVIKGLLPGPVRPKTKILQMNPSGLSHYHLPMASGTVWEASPDGTEVTVELEGGRFASESVCPGAPVFIEGRNCGAISRVESLGSVAYKEFVSSTPTPPTWYTCHWWGEVVLDFVACCEEHARLRHLPEDQQSYWICAYANRQHDLDAEINVTDLAETSFFKAMTTAAGVLLILDPKATPFSRMWCSFELYKTITDESKLLDVASVLPPEDMYKERAVLLADGLLPGEPQRAKMVRESHFPHQLLMDGMTQALEDGGCYLASDKRKILSFMAKDGPEDWDEASRTACAVSRANQALKGNFALWTWSFAVQNGLVRDLDGDEGDVDINLIEVLKADASRKSINFSLAHYTEVENDDLEDFLSALPPNLVRLGFSVESCINVTNAGLQAFENSLPSGLRELSLSIMGCQEISDDGMASLATEIGRLQNLTHLKIDCGMCPDISKATVVKLASVIRPDMKVQIILRGTRAGPDINSQLELRLAAKVVFGHDLGQWFGRLANLARNMPGWGRSYGNGRL